MFTTKSSISLVEPNGKKNKDINGIDVSSKSRRSSNSSIKSYILKHVNPLSLSLKGKSSTVDSISEPYNYWPVTEDATLFSDEFFSHSPKNPSKNPNKLFKSPSSSSKKHKLQKTNSFTDLRSLKKIWTDADKTSNASIESGNSTSHYLTPHVEDDGENSINDKERLSAATNSEGNEGNHKLREQLFRKIVTKKRYLRF